MRTARLLCALLFLSSSLFAVPKYFFIRTMGTPDGAQYDSQRNLIYISSPQTSQVVAADAVTGQIVKSVYVPNAAGMDLMPDGKRLVVGTTAFGGWYGDSFLTFIDLDTFTVMERMPIGNPIRADFNGYALNTPFVRRVVALYNGNILLSASAAGSTETWVAEYHAPTGTFTLVAPGTILMFPSADRKRVLLPGVGYRSGLGLFEADADAITVFNPNVSGLAVSLSDDGTLVSSVNDQQITQILDANTLQPIRTIATPTAGFHSFFSHDNKKVYIQSFAMPGFWVFDVATGLVQGAIAVPGDDHDIVNMGNLDSRGMLYTSLDRGLAVTEVDPIGFFTPPGQYAGDVTPPGGTIGGGTAVTIVQNYPAHPTVYFGDKVATITGSDSSGIHVVAPPGDRPGPTDITVRYDDGFISYIAEGYSYGPSIELLNRDGGSTSGGDAVTLFVLGLRSATDTSVRVQIGGAAATISSISKMYISPMKSPTFRINLTTPPGAAGKANVVLTTADGSSTLQGGFTYAPMTNLGGKIAVSHMVYDESRGYLYRCDYGNNLVEVVDAASGQTIKQYTTHSGPVAMALSLDRSTLYVTTNGSYIDVISLNSAVQSVISVALPAGMYMTRIGVTSKGTLFVGIFNPDIIYDSRLIEVDPSNGSFTTRLEHFNGNYLEIGLARDGSRGFISCDLEAGASGSDIFYWDSFTDTFREQFVGGQSDYGVDDAAALFLGSSLVYDENSYIRNALENFSFDMSSMDFVYGEKLDDSGALAIRPALDSLMVYDLHHGNRIVRMALPAQTLVTLDAMAVDSVHGYAYLSTKSGLLKVALPNVLSIGRIEPTQGLTGGGQQIKVRGFGFQSHASVKIGGLGVATQFVDSTTLLVTAPALEPGSVSIEVTNDDGKSYVVPAAYTAVGTQPIISGTSPNRFRATDGMGYGTLNFTVVGMNFASGAVALWNGSPRSTYFVDDTELQVNLEIADVASAGAGTLSVRNPDGGVSNAITVPIKKFPFVDLPLSYSFSGQQVNTSSPMQTATVTNRGTDAVTLSFSTGFPFTMTTDCPASIPGGASCNLSAGFNPTSPGRFSGAISVTGDYYTTIALTGIAGLSTAGLAVYPSEVKFPDTNTFAQSWADVVFTNVGLPDVTINSVSVDSSDFDQTSYASPTILTGDSGKVSVEFRPTTSTGPRTGNLVINTSAGIYSIPLKGNAIQKIGFDTLALTIQALKGQTAGSTAVVTFANSGGLGVNIVGVSIVPGSGTLAFTQTNTCPAVLNGGSSCKITVSYVPSGAATDTANLSVTTNLVAYSLSLRGVTTDFALTGSNLSATIAAGQSTTYPVSIDTSGGYSGNLTFSCAGAPLHSTCSVDPQTVNAGSAVTNVNISVITTARISARVRSTVAGYLGFAVLAFGCVFLRRPASWRAVLTLTLFGVMGFTACGGGSGGSTPPPPVTTGTPAGTYALTVTATTPNGGTRSIPLTLKVN